MKWFERDVEIRYADTDQMGVVHHSVYPIYCELSRLTICERLGLPYHRLEELGYFLMVGKMDFRFTAPARFGEAVYVRGAISQLNKRMMSFCYEVRNRAGEALLCTGSSVHVVTRGLAGPASLPRDLLAIFAAGYEEGA